MLQLACAGSIVESRVLTQLQAEGHTVCANKLLLMAGIMALQCIKELLPPLNL